MNRILFEQDDLVEISFFEKALLEGELLILQETKNMSNESDKAAALNNCFQKDKGNYYKVMSGFVKIFICGGSSVPETVNLFCLVTKDNFFSFSTLLCRTVEQSWHIMSEFHLFNLTNVAGFLIKFNTENVSKVVFFMLKNITPGSWLRKNVNFVDYFVSFLSKNRRFISSLPNLYQPTFQKILRLLPESFLFADKPTLITELTDLLQYVYSLKKDELLQSGIDILRLLIPLGRSEIPIVKTIIENFAVPAVFSNSTSEKKRNFVYADLFVPSEVQRKVDFILKEVSFSTFKFYLKWLIDSLESENDSSDLSLWPDIVRYVVTNYPGESSLDPSVRTPRWLFIRQLIASCRSQIALADIKLAVFLDFLYFDEFLAKKKGHHFSD